MSSTSLAVPGGAPPASQPSSHLVGLMRVAGTLVALPVDAIREVVLPPRQYTVLPLQSPDLHGAFKLRDDIIAVLDLASALGLTQADGSERVVAVMRWQGRLLGLLVDKVCGMLTIPSLELFELVSLNPQRRRLSNHGFLMGEEVGALLDPAQIAGLPDIPLSPEQSLSAPGRNRPTGESLLLFTVRGAHFAIDAGSVSAAVSRTGIEQNALSIGYCLGVINHHGAEVPVVDTLAALQIAEPESVSESPVVVVRFPGGGLLGFTVEHVRDILRIGSGDIRKLPPMAQRQLGLFRGVLADTAGRQHIVLDVAGMHQDPKFLSLATLRKANKTAEAKTEDAPARQGKPYLMYKAGEARASALSQVNEILPLPNNIASFGGAAELLGLVGHRGVALPLVCLTTFLGGKGCLDPRKARVLVIQAGDLAVGFVVEELYAIEPIRWDLGLAPTHQWSAPSLLPELLMFGEPATRRLVCHIDLFEKLRAFAGAGDPPEPRDLPRLCAA